MEATLIVAATQSMGIGYQGRIPWRTQLINENAYFHRVTKRAAAGTMNAIIMGRKSWDACKKPMVDRINIVVTRNPAKVQQQIQSLCRAMRHVHVVSGLEEAYTLLRITYGQSYAPQDQHNTSSAAEQLPRLGRIFITGGDVARCALTDTRTTRFLLSVVEQDFQCDAFVPIPYTKQGIQDWRRSDVSRHEAWIEEVIPKGLVHENGLDYEFMMFERAA